MSLKQKLWCRGNAARGKLEVKKSSRPCELEVGRITTDLKELGEPQVMVGLDYLSKIKGCGLLTCTTPLLGLREGIGPKRAETPMRLPLKCLPGWVDTAFS